MSPKQWSSARPQPITIKWGLFAYFLRSTALWDRKSSMRNVFPGLDVLLLNKNSIGICFLTGRGGQVLVFLLSGFHLSVLVGVWLWCKYKNMNILLTAQHLKAIIISLVLEISEYIMILYKSSPWSPVHRPLYKWFECGNAKYTEWIVLKFGLHIGSNSVLSRDCWDMVITELNMIEEEKSLLVCTGFHRAFVSVKFVAFHDVCTISIFMMLKISSYAHLFSTTPYWNIHQWITLFWCGCKNGPWIYFAK